MKTSIKNRNQIGIYVLSFDMKFPMSYWEKNPGSDSFVSSQMIKVGKTQKFLKRMEEYKNTYGFREFEPNTKVVREYWKERGLVDINFNRCLGCDNKEPHHHVVQEYWRSTGFVSNDIQVVESLNKDIESRIKKEYSEFRLKGHDNIGRLAEYYCKSQKNKIIDSIDKIINEYG